MNYIEDALRTKSDKFYANKVSVTSLKISLRDFIAAAQWLDMAKKALFYGKDFGHVTSAARSQLWEDVLIRIQEGSGCDGQQAVDLLHSMLGKMTEAGETAEALMKVIDGAPFDETNWIEETGDSQWYDAIGCAALGVSFELVQDRNIAKLSKRFPDKFTEDKANNRDLTEERKTLETQTARMHRRF